MSLFSEEEVSRAAERYALTKSSSGVFIDTHKRDFKAGVEFAEKKCLDAVSNIIIENQGLKLLKDNFPNGLTSYLETYYEVVDFITATRLGENGSCKRLEQVESSIGHGGLWELAQELTDKFEQQHKDEEWVDKDWFETINDFLEKELYETT